MPVNEENVTAANKRMEEYHGTPQVGFQFSMIAIVLLNASAGAWLFGMAIPLVSALHPTATLTERGSAPASIPAKPTSNRPPDQAAAPLRNQKP
jgi:hypothetical protein